MRAGLNLSTWQGGELEKGETLGINTGFHFGVNYTYQLSSKFGIRGELQYIQRGTNHNFIDTIDGAYNLIKPTDLTVTPFFAYGDTELEMQISTGYLSIPVTAQFQLSDKFEVFGGISLDLLLNPIGRGNLKFDNAFRQGYEHNYRRDEAGEAITFGNQTRTLAFDVNGEVETIFKTIGAYYDYSESFLEENGKRFKLVDSHLIFGLNYFINSGFYLGIRGEYGLVDITNNQLDFSLRELNPDETYIRRSDSDKSISTSISFGFRF